MVRRQASVRGVPIPGFLYGTAWKEERTAALVRRALEAGFTGLDTANQRKHYVEAAVGDAVAAWIAAGRGTREGLFLQTKFTPLGGQDHRLPYDPAGDVASQVRQSFASSLEHLRTGYVDSYVLHGPASSRGLVEGDWAAWRAMEELQRQGLARLVGVSNVSLAQLTGFWGGSAVKPAFVQNRCFAITGWDRAVRAFCAEHGIVYQGFSLLTANPRELRSEAIAGAAQRRGCTAAQVVFAFAAQMGMLPLTGTASEAHLREDLASLAIELDPAELEAIERVSG